MTGPSRHGFLRVLNNEQQRLAIRSWPAILGYLLLTTGPFIYLDFYHWDLEVAYVWLGFLSWGLNYLLLLWIMNRGGYFAGGKTSGIGTYFALGLITGLAISLALVVLILPGLYLAMRWLPVYSRVLTSEEWITQSLRWSWQATEPFQKPLALALLGPFLLFGLSMVAAYSYGTVEAVPYEAATVIVNVAQALGIAWWTVLGAASFGLLVQVDGPRGELQQTATLV